jgi:hypothetical protein
LESTLQVKRTSRAIRPHITADAEGLVSHVGAQLLAELADEVGLTGAFSRAMAPLRQRRGGHDRGAVLRDLAVMLADGGDCMSDLAVLRQQPELFGEVASDPTVSRVLGSIGPEVLAALAAARAEARCRVWESGGAPTGDLVLDFDATLLTAHSDKEKAAGNYKHGYGFHPLLCYLDNTTEGLGGELRPGSAGANTAADHIGVLDASVMQIPKKWRDPARMLVRADSAGATHEFLDELRSRGIRFSVGFDLTAPVRAAVLSIPDEAWVPAIRADCEERPGSDVCELTHLDLSRWPEGTRAICRREEPHPGAQLTFTDIDGYRFQVFITDQTETDIAYLEARHRGHARVEDRIRCAKETGLRNLPLHDFDGNAAWLQLVLTAQDLLAWLQQLCLTGAPRAWEPKTLRYRLLHMCGRLTRSGRRLTLHLPRNWPWAEDLLRAFTRLRALPASA